MNAGNTTESPESVLVYSIVTSPAHGRLEGCLNNTGDLSCVYIPDENFNGTDEFTYIASDGLKSFIQVTTVKINIECKNDAPYFKEIHVAEIPGGVISTIDITPAFDVDGDELLYEIVDSPNNAIITNCFGGTTSLQCQIDPDIIVGEITFTIRAFDLQTYSNLQTIRLQVR